MGAYMRLLDWSKTPLGPVSQWPQSLRTSVSTCLNSRFPIVIWWGPDLLMLYNDAYRDIIASKHPAALARPGRECWPEIWHIIGPMLEGVVQRGEATWANDLLLVLERNRYGEECYFTFSYSPIRDESGGIGGVFTPVAETTEHVIGERRLRTLQSLASQTRGVRDVKAAFEIISQTLSENPYCIPFASLYLFDADGASATLQSCCGSEPGSAVAQHNLRVSSLPAALSEAARSPRMTAIDNLADLLGPLPRGAWDTSVLSGVVLPISTPVQSEPVGFVLAGANPRKRLDPSFLTFFELVGRHISSAIADARAYQDERRRAEALAELDRAKTVFFSNISHEFRTPLTLMLGPVETILDRARPSTVVSRGELQLVHRNAMRLLKLVNALLDFSRIESGRMEARYEPTDLAGFTAEIASAFESAMELAGLDYVIDCPRLPEPAYIDRDMWERIVLNLISNAFKFTITGRVSVRVQSENDRFELQVEDTGTGIPESELPHIFDRFHRVAGAQGRTQEGSGIGLALVQQLTHLHSGTIQVRTAIGKGTSFVISIPKGRQHLPAEHVADSPSVASQGAAASAYVDEAILWLPESQRPAEPRLVFAADTVQAPHSHIATGRILLADDNADMREYVRRLLGEHYQVRAVENGREALESARDTRPDLILTDVMMPGLDGFELLRELRASEETATIPVILLSARAGEEARVEGLSAGADDYIVKPFTARELLARVDAHLSMSRLRREAAEQERALRTEAEAAQQRTAAILESIRDAFIALDSGWRFAYVNAEAERSMALTRDELIGRSFWEVFREAQGTELETGLHRAMRERSVLSFENFYEPWRCWLEIRAYPAGDGGLSLFYQEITGRKQAEEAVRRANEALRAANADLEQFAHSASHDLREPLRTIRLQCELLSRKYAGKLGSDADEMLAFCMDGAARMESLLNGLLAYTHASTDMSGSIEPVALEGPLQDALRNLETAIREAGAVITQDAMPVLEIAPVHAQLLFQNLISNAVKYHGSETLRVHVGARYDRGSWIFSVQDNGIGIPAEHTRQIFGIFKRLHTQSEFSGSGIGLAICKKIVERYGGRIWVESEVGRGSTFLFSIPGPPR